MFYKEEEIMNEQRGIPFGRQNFMKNVIYYLRMRPPAFDQAALWLKKELGTSEEVGIIAFDYIGSLLQYDKQEDFAKFWNDEADDEIPPQEERPSRYLYDVIEFLLRQNLDPNFATETESLMYRVCRVDNGFIAADTLKLLLENGGDPYVPTGKRTLLEMLDSYINLALGNHRPGDLKNSKFQSRIHSWFVLLGFSKIDYSNIHDSLAYRLLQVDNGQFRVEELKNHQNYSVEIVGDQESYHRNAIRIIDTRCNKEISRL